MLTTRLNAASRFVGIDRDHNAMVLARAKRALIGWVAMNAANAGEDNPGRFPCPEAFGDFGNPSNEGRTAPSCTLPKVGRLPWRTLGLDRMIDAAGEPLWYAVSPGWAFTSSNLVINSNTPGQLAVDAQPDAAVAILVAPGAPTVIPASPSCTARTQARNGAPPADGYCNYLDYVDVTATGGFRTSGPASSFNDQVLVITVGDVLPAIEAAVAYRFERQIAPAIRSAYSNSDPANPNPAWPTSNAVLPFAAPFGNPQTSNLKGVAANFQGLLPLNRFQTACTCSPAPCECSTPAAACSPAGVDGCDPTFVQWTGAATMSGADVYSPSCSTSPTQITCDFHIRVLLLGLIAPANVSFTLQASAQNVGMGLRRFQTEAPMPGVLVNGRSLSGTLNADGSASVTLNAQADTTDAAGGGLLGNLLCGIGGLLGLTLGCAHDTITVPITVFVDNPVTDPSDPALGWFRRNHWYEVSYFALAPSIAPSGSGSCVTGTSCLSVNFLAPNGAQRGLIVIAGQSLSGQARPPAALSDWLEGENAVVDNQFAVRDPGLTINRTFNDRIGVIDSNP
ncbi:MAG: hypothetical protein ACREDY_23530 [Bradyrhizobium sp.]